MTASRLVPSRRQLAGGASALASSNGSCLSRPPSTAVIRHFDARFAAIRKEQERFVNEALFLLMVEDVRPRAMSARVEGFAQAQNWYHDLMPVTMG